MSKRNELLYRVYIVLGMFVVFGGLILIKAFNIGVLEQEQWRAEKEKQYVKSEVIKAERGNIYAEDKSLLATSLQFFDIRMDFRATGLTDLAFQQGVDSLAICLSTYVDPSKSASYFKNWLLKKRNAKSGNRYVLLAKRMTFEELERIKNFPILRRGANKGGLIVRPYGKRQLPFGPLAERTIGYVRENAEDVGLESAFNNYLKGQEGEQLMMKVGRNEYVPQGNVRAIEPVRGADVVTTLDVNIQDITHHALLRALEEHKAEWGTAIVMDVETGAIKAISNLGSVGDGKYAERYNYAVGTAVEPGSTFKLASLMALLEDGKIDLSDSVDLNKGYGRFCGSDLKDSEPHDYNQTTVLKAFERSSNVGMAKLVRAAYDVDQEAKKFTDRLKSFQLDQLTRIEIEGEHKPFIKDAFSQKENWSCTSLPWMAIGYELTMTPLQIATFYNAVANDGKMMAPYLVSEVVKDGHIEKKVKPRVLKRSIAKATTIAKAKEALESVVEEGTARRLQSKYYSFAGKTGTTQVGYGTAEGRKHLKYQSSFVGYFPANNPKYTCLVMIYNPDKKTGYYGSVVAGPVFREIADRCFATELDMGNPFDFAVRVANKEETLPAEHKLMREDWLAFQERWEVPYRGAAESEWVYLKLKKDSLEGLPFFNSEEKVPDVRGMALKDAVYLLENAGLKVQFAGLGKVESQSLRPGTRIEGQVISLKLG